MFKWSYGHGETFGKSRFYQGKLFLDFDEVFIFATQGTTLENSENTLFCTSNHYISNQGSDFRKITMNNNRLLLF